MRKSVVIALAIAFVAVFSMGTASADDLIPGAYGNQDQSVMGVSQSMMQMGAADRAHANYVNARSGAGKHMRNSGNNGGADWQFGSSQTEQSWKAAKTIEEAQVRGLVAGDCQGDNSTDAYRKQMNQNRDGFMKEPLVSNAQCAEIHPTLR
ncbi:hypothetical protein UZ36_05845 [Candidatus Nitromaritima sp. SCGC AAA799-C22]|nr:hypothetical protein UZ36_05845 [Candidatus Nitromaritima sp. SCGC AAA799-C22]